MRLVPGGPDEVRRLLRARADEQAAMLVPRPGYPIYGLTAPALRFAGVSESSSYNGQWTSVTLSYGDPDDQGGPRVTVSTSAREADFMARRHPERRPDAVTQRDVENVTVTVATWDVPADAVRTGPVSDLRPLIEAALAGRIARIERRQREPRPPQPPPPDLPPAEGAAALRALADFTLAAHREVRDSARAGQRPQHPPDWGRMRSALWQRSVSERRRIAGSGAEAADADVTSAVNHLGQLLEHAPWFEADARLREAATTETVRYVMLSETVPSLRAQQAWAAYWDAHLSGAGQAPPIESVDARRPLLDDWLAAWDAWTATA